jgi:hypothetical protein
LVDRKVALWGGESVVQMVEKLVVESVVRMVATSAAEWDGMRVYWLAERTVGNLGLKMALMMVGRKDCWLDCG